MKTKKPRPVVLILPKPKKEKTKPADKWIKEQYPEGPAHTGD